MELKKNFSGGHFPTVIHRKGFINSLSRREKRGKKNPQTPNSSTGHTLLNTYIRAHTPEHKRQKQNETSPPEGPFPECRAPVGVLQQVGKMAVHRVQEGLAGFLAFDPNDLKEPVQFVLSLGDLFNHPQLLGIQDVQHVIKDGLQVTGVQADLPQHRVLLFCGGQGKE